jgi:hypothetical protein
MNLITNQTEIIYTQTIHPPFDELGLVEAHHKLVSEHIQWSDVGILIDQHIGEQCATLITLIQNNRVASVFRICLNSPEKTLASIRLFTPDKSAPIIFRVCQNKFFDHEQIQSLDKVDLLWREAESQSIELIVPNELGDIVKIFFKPPETGRGKEFTTGTKRKVYMEAHGRCMFEGCGANLSMDETTGYEGNYAYLAHNVASAENGPRGIVVMSKYLSDDPSNILLLCDKHHRLVDKIAASDYPAQRLSKMRADFCTTATSLLNCLSYEPIPALSITWPVQRTSIAAPSNIQINQSMARMNWRMNSAGLMSISDNDSMLKDFPSDQLHSFWPRMIEDASAKIFSLIGRNQFRAVLFAFGLMPQLIALGAKIGNKQEIIPMLRYRDGNQWIWPADNPQGKNYDISGLEHLEQNESEIILTLSFTQHSPVFNEFAKETKLKMVKIQATVMGNGALGHPEDGIKFMAEMQRLLHTLKCSYGVNRIHLLPCASNAVCVFFGKAFDVHHPEITIYDFDDGTMVPILHVKNENGLCKIESA